MPRNIKVDVEELRSIRSDLASCKSQFETAASISNSASVIIKNQCCVSAVTLPSAIMHTTSLLDGSLQKGINAVDLSLESFESVDHSLSLIADDSSVNGKKDKGSIIKKKAQSIADTSREEIESIFPKSEASTIASVLRKGLIDNTKKLAGKVLPSKWLKILKKHVKVSSTNANILLAVAQGAIESDVEIIKNDYKLKGSYQDNAEWWAKEYVNYDNKGDHLRAAECWAAMFGLEVGYGIVNTATNTLGDTVSLVGLPFKCINYATELFGKSPSRATRFIENICDAGSSLLKEWF